MRIFDFYIMQWEKWENIEMKKKIVIIVFAIIFVGVFLIYPKYRTMNIFDEIIVTADGGYLSWYVDTDFIGMDANFKKLSHWGDSAEVDFMFHEDEVPEIHAYTERNHMYINCWMNLSEDITVELCCEYNGWKKKLTQKLIICEWRKDTFFYTAEQAKPVLQKYGTDVESIYKMLKGEFNELLQEWIDSNEGKSKYTVEDVGYCEIEPYTVVTKEEWLLKYEE